MKVGIYAGSFDPVTQGHLWVIQQGSQLFDELRVVIGYHPRKTFQYSERQRLQFLNKVCADIPNVVVDRFGEYHSVLRYAYNFTEHAYLLRGIRDEKDFRYEAEILGQLEEDADFIGIHLHQVYVIPPADLRNISSTQVRQAVDPHILRQLVPPQIVDDVIVNNLNIKGK